jgi:hypothetical protein
MGAADLLLPASTLFAATPENHGFSCFPFGEDYEDRWFADARG